jgi:hypothetical protein
MWFEKCAVFPAVTDLPATGGGSPRLPEQV